MAQSRAESTMDTYNYGQYLNQFPPNTMKVTREFERIQKKICRHKMSIVFNEICIYIYIYIYIYDNCHILTEDSYFYHQNYNLNILINKLFNFWKIYNIQKIR